jgi:hypothetical protein
LDLVNDYGSTGGGGGGAEEPVLEQAVPVPEVKHISPLPLDKALHLPVLLAAVELTIQTYLVAGGSTVSTVVSSWKEVRPTKAIIAKAGNRTNFKCFLIIVSNFKLMKWGIHFL